MNEVIIGNWISGEISPLLSSDSHKAYLVEQPQLIEMAYLQELLQYGEVTKVTEDNCMKKLLDISVLIEEFEFGKLDSAKTMRLIKDIVEAPVYPVGE
ncbi:MAG: hypothetical protein WCB79_01685 [Halobacteriota archaeon]